jgi:hypothetical protein
MVCVSTLDKKPPAKIVFAKRPISIIEQKANKIVQAFNTWAFKREQPSSLLLLNRFATRSVVRNEPLSFVLYWGKGPRSLIGQPERECLRYLATLASRVQAVHEKGASINIVLTDTHARLNGHSAADMASYFQGVTASAQSHGFQCFLLGDLTRAADGMVETENLAVPSEETLMKLCNSAERWYRGDGTAIEGARQYYHMNMIEKQAIELFFPSSVFVTFNGHDFRELFPDSLPIFYMYSLRRGMGVKPWFLPDEEQPCSVAVNA